MCLCFQNDPWSFSLLFCKVLTRVREKNIKAFIQNIKERKAQRLQNDCEVNATSTLLLTHILQKGNGQLIRISSPSCIKLLYIFLIFNLTKLFFKHCKSANYILNIYLEVLFEFSLQDFPLKNCSYLSFFINTCAQFIMRYGKERCSATAGNFILTSAGVIIVV